MNKKVSSGQDSLIKAYDYAVFLLGIRLRTVGEMKAKLGAKGYRPEVIERVIAELTQQHYLNDLRFAEIFLDNFKKYKHFGYYGIKKKMTEKRLPAPVIERVLSEGLTEDEELKIAKKLVKNFKLDAINFKEKQKMASKLAAKGFRTQIIRKTIF